MMNVRYLFIFLKIPLENIFWLIVLSYSLYCFILFFQVVLLYALPLFQQASIKYLSAYFV